MSTAARAQSLSLLCITLHHLKSHPCPHICRLGPGFGGATRVEAHAVDIVQLAREPGPEAPEPALGSDDVEVGQAEGEELPRGMHHRARHGLLITAAEHLSNLHGMSDDADGV